MPPRLLGSAPTLATATPPLRTMVSVGGKRTPISARTDRALIEAEASAARWNAVRIA